MDQKRLGFLLILQTYFLQTSMNVAMILVVLNILPVSIMKENLSVFALKDMSEMEKTTAQLVSAKFVF